MGRGAGRCGAAVGAWGAGAGDASQGPVFWMQQALVHQSPAAPAGAAWAPHLLNAAFTVSSSPLKVRNKASILFGVFSARFWLEATLTSCPNPTI